MNRLRDLIIKNPGLKLLALVMAVVLWFMAVGREKAEVSLTVPLEMVNCPSDLVIANQVPDGVSVRIRGSAALTRQAVNRKPRFSLDLSKAAKGPIIFTFKPGDLKLPRGLEVTHLSPAKIIVELEQLIVKSIRVLPVIKGGPVTGFVIDDISLEPKEIKVKGPESILIKLDGIWTEPVDVTNLTKSETLTTRPALPDVSVSLVGPAEIKAEIKIAAKIITRPFKNVPVRAVNTAYRFDIRPQTVELFISGPLSNMSELVAGKKLTVKLDLAGLRPGRHRRPVIVEVPENMSVVKVKPDKIKIKIHKELIYPDHE